MRMVSSSMPQIFAADHRIVLRHQRLEVLEAFGMAGDVLLVLQTFRQDHMGQRIQQHQVGAGVDGQMHIGHLRQHGDARIDHDQRELALFARLAHAPVDDRVLLRQIGAEGDQAIGVFEIVIAAGRAVGTEGALVAGHRRGHAQRGVAVVVVGADQPARELAERVELLGHDLAGGDDGEGVAAVLGLDAFDLVRGACQRLIPTGLLEGSSRRFAQQRHGAAPGASRTIRARGCL